MMVSSGTLHNISTELTIGILSLAGLCMAIRTAVIGREFQFSDHLDKTILVAVLAGLASLPVTIFTGYSAMPGDDIDQAILANKLTLSMFAMGLYGAFIYNRIQQGSEIWEDRRSGMIHGGSGMLATGLILMTASLGGTYNRGESLIDFLPLMKDEATLIPIWASAIVMLLAIAAMVVPRFSRPQP